MYIYSMILELICHVLHIAATCTSLGGLFYARMVLIPNVPLIPEAARPEFLAKMIRRYAYIKWTGVVVLVVTGIIQWLDVYPTVADKQSYMTAFLIKMAGAIGLFSITFMLAIPVEKLKGMQQNRRFWTTINIICGIILLIGAAMMRAVRNGTL